MKKLLAILMVMALVLGMAAGCAKTEEGEQTEDKLQIVLVCPQKLGDAGPMDDMNQNLQKAAAEFDNIETAVYEATEAAQYEEVLRTYARDGVDMIVTSMPAMVQAVKTVAAEYPDVLFTILFPLDSFDLPNVKVVDFAIWEAYYLAGIMAASMSESGTIGHCIGAEQSALLANYNAYMAGAMTVNPDINVVRVNTNTFDDPAKGKDAGISMAGQGCDVIQTDLASTALGVIEAGEELGFFVMADSSEHHEVSPTTILGDTLCKYGPALYSAVSSFVNGEWNNETHYSSLSEGGVGLSISPLISEYLSEEQKAKFDAAVALIEDASEKIISGELVVEYNPNP
ncbi:MAG: BMP family ABC transporter substrate-binding protein [Clostridia bacterium]|nr:BMP family ABC transporter substrate-binding protein [Clostridia bacterium]